MASEAEFERLYQEFVRNGGGTHTFDSANRTPAEYYDSVNGTELSPEQIAALEAAEQQYNRQAALNVILDELTTNNFTNPYDSIATNGINTYAAYSVSPEVLAVATLGSTINEVEDVSTREQLIAIVGGLMFLATPTVGPQATSMYTSMLTHTNSQVSDFVTNLSTAASLANMSKNFGDTNASSGCSIFNTLMGLLSGEFDGVLDFIGDVASKITDAISSILSVINDITNAIRDFIDGVVSTVIDVVTALVAPIAAVIAAVAGFVSGAISAIGDVVDQIASEIAKLLSMAEDLANKALALALGAAAMDPCQVQAILNVGSDNLKGAVTQLTTPVASAAPVVQTENDPRASASVVNATMANAVETAAHAAGVPQSPMRASSATYSPFSAYLHKVVGAIGSAFGATAITKGVVEAVGKLGDRVGITERNTRNELGSQAGANSQDIGSRDANVTTTIQSSAYKQFYNEYGKPMLSTKAKINALVKRMQNNQSSISSEQKARSNILIEQLTSQQTKISAFMTSTTNSLEYTVIGNKNINDTNERKLQAEYDNTLSDRAKRVLNRGKTVYNNSLAEWNSISESTNN